MKRLLTLVAFLVLVLGVLAGNAPALTQTFTFGFGTAGVVGPVGEIIPLGTAVLPAGVANQSCTATITMNNNDSVHNGSQLVLSSGAMPPLILNDVESKANAAAVFTARLRVYDSMEVEGVLGTDPADGTGGFSGGGSITLSCDVPEPPKPPVVPPAPPAAAVVITPSFTG